jgi:hypothetical protein
MENPDDIQEKKKDPLSKKYERADSLNLKSTSELF